MFRLLDRYVLRQVLAPFMLVLLIFTFILEMQPFMDVADKFVAKGAAWSVVARVMATLIPQALALTVPMALLIGLLIAFGRLSEDREWVAMQSCGVSLYRMARPVAVLAGLAWAASLYMMLRGVPDANQAFREIAYGVIATRAESEVKPHVFFQDFENQVLYVRDVRPGVRGWSDVFLADISKPTQPVVYVARHGEMLLDRARRTVDMVLEDGYRHTEEPQKYQVMRFGTLRFALDPNTVFAGAGPAKGLREMTVPELRKVAADLERQGVSPHGPLIEIHKKYSIPVACLVFALAALGLGLSNRKDGKFASFVLGLVVIFVYYIFMWTGQNLVKGRVVPAWFGMWVPNLVLLPLGVFLVIWRARWGDRSLQLPQFFRAPQAEGGQEPPPGGTPARGGRRGRVRLVIRVPRIHIPRPNILDRYIARSYLRIFALSFFGLLSIFYIATFIDMSERLFKGTATVQMLVRFCGYLTPQYVYFVIPMSALVATLVTIGLLTKNSELVVMKACGISLYRTAVPMLLLSVVWSAALFALAENVVPEANKKAQELRQVMLGQPPRIFDVLNRRWIVGRNGRIYNYVSFDPRRAVLTGLSIYEFDSRTWQMVRRTYCLQAFLAGARDSGTVAWRATDGWVREFSAGPAAARAGSPPAAADDVIRNMTPFREMTLQLERPEYFGTEEPNPELMTYPVLKRYIDELRAGGFNVVRYTVQLHAKIAFPFVALVMTLLAVPFAVTTGKRGALYGVGLGIVLAMTYWVSSQVFQAIGSGGMLMPLLAAWAPNLLFGAGATYLLLTVRT